MKMYLLIVCAIVAFASPTRTSAQLSPQQVYAAQKWWKETGGPALQKALGHKGFRAVKPSVPILIINPTANKIFFELGSANTKKTKHALDPGESADFFGHNGDRWYNVYFDNGQEKVTAVSFDGGEAIYFTWEDGELCVYSIQTH